MAQVSVQLNGKAYTVGCEDGQEGHLLELARLFDAQVRQVSQSVGQLGETRLFMMAGLMMADELAEAQAQAAKARSELEALRAGGQGVDARAAAALDAAAQRIEALAASVGSDAA